MGKRVFFGAMVLLLFLVGFFAGCATGGGQPHMNAALDELRSARRELDAATADKGGHRLRAIALVDDAVREVESGINYARR